MTKTPTQLDREIKQALAERDQRTHGVDTIRPRSHTGQPLPINRPPPQHGVDIIRPRTRTGTDQAALIDRPVLYGVDTIQPRGRASQPASMSRQPPALHGVDTIKPRRSTSHARKKKLDPHEARSHLEAAGVDFSRDFHELPSSNVELLLSTARAAGYRKRKDAPGSTARMYFQYLSRLR
jgi:hypothetical protein